MRLIARPLDAAAFAPFGSVAAAPTDDSVTLGPLDNRRPGVGLVVRWTRASAQHLPLVTTVMERHRFSSQTFIPGDRATRWLILVASQGSDGGPDLASAQAFIATGEQAVTYAPDIWHHPVCALDAEARFTVATHLDGGPDDDEFTRLPHEVEIVAQA